MVWRAVQEHRRPCLASRYTPTGEWQTLQSTDADTVQGISGLTKRDIQLFVDAGYNTVESVAYTYIPRRQI